MGVKCEKWKRYSGVFRVTFFAFYISHQGPAFAWKLKGFCFLFFRGIKKTRNSTEMRKVYSECFVFCGVFRENIHKILTKCEIQKVYSRPYSSFFIVWIWFSWIIYTGNTVWEPWGCKYLGADAVPATTSHLLSPRFSTKITRTYRLIRRFTGNGLWHHCNATYFLPIW